MEKMAPQYGSEMITTAQQVLGLTFLVLCLIWLLVHFQRKKNGGYGKSTWIVAIPTLLWALVPSLAPRLYSSDPTIISRMLPRPEEGLILLPLLAATCIAYGAFSFVYLGLWRSTGGKKRAGLFLPLLLVVVAGILASLGDAA